MYLLSLLILAGVRPAVAGPQVDWSWQVSGRAEQLRPQSLTGAALHQQVQAMDTRLDASFQWDELTGLAAIRSRNIWASDETDADHDLILQELFWQSGTEVAGIPLDISLGKMRLDWGVGYGYRPLNILKPYQRNPVGIQVEEGAGVAMASYFDGLGEWAFLVSDAGWARETTNDYEKNTRQKGFGLRRYALLGDTELQVIAYYDQIRRGLLGASAVTVLNEAWEIHASVVAQHQYKAYRQQSLFAPVTLETAHHAYQLLTGINWADMAGVNLIAEYWYDSRSWHHSQWRQALKRSRQLAQNQATSPLALSYANGLNHENIVQHNLMLHVSLDSAAWSQWQWSRQYLWLSNFEPTFDVLISPSDGGVIATQWLDYTLYDSGQASLMLELAGRFYTGRSGSVYADLPDKRVILLNLKGSF
nr:hypothetical protein [Vibrio aerogenes]